MRRCFYPVQLREQNGLYRLRPHYIFLKEKKWIFIKRIALTCLVGSCILLPYSLFEQIRFIDKSFLISLIIAVSAMIIIYYNAVRQSLVSSQWFWVWVCCLAIAISLQIFAVFNVL